MSELQHELRRLKYDDNYQPRKAWKNMEIQDIKLGDTRIRIDQDAGNYGVEYQARIDGLFVTHEASIEDIIERAYDYLDGWNIEELYSFDIDEGVEQDEDGLSVDRIDNLVLVITVPYK
jgi:hypothetical protein